MAGTIRPNDMDVSPPPASAAGALAALASLQTDLVKKASPRAPRIDVEPLYAALKGAIADSDWALYKQALAFFLLGNLNQAELTRALARILTTPALEHAHNALLAAVYANIWRDAPDAGIATWVSSSDKPTTSTVKGAADEAEKRLKHEVMQLSRRERNRLKMMPAADGCADGLGATGPVQDYVEARRAKQLDVGLSSIQGGGFGKTNWDLEIRKRYTSALYVETHEFPTATTISHRLLPICYEFGLPQGHTPDCPDYLNIATETYIKEALAALLGKVCSNGPTYIRTAAFKKKLAREERLVERGDLIRGPGAELPVEADERRKRKLLCTEDLRLALQLGDSYLGQTPFLAGAITNSRALDTWGADSGLSTGSVGDTGHQENRVLGPNENSSHGNSGYWLDGQLWTVDVGDTNTVLLDEDIGSHWQGGGVQDVAELDGALDDILSIGDL